MNNLFDGLLTPALKNEKGYPLPDVELLANIEMILLEVLKDAQGSFSESGYSYLLSEVSVQMFEVSHSIDNRRRILKYLSELYLRDIAIGGMPKPIIAIYWDTICGAWKNFSDDANDAALIQRDLLVTISYLYGLSGDDLYRYGLEQGLSHLPEEYRSTQFLLQSLAKG